MSFIETAINFAIAVCLLGYGLYSAIVHAHHVGHLGAAWALMALTLLAMWVLARLAWLHGKAKRDRKRKYRHIDKH